MCGSTDIDKILSNPDKVKEVIESATWKNNPDKLLSVESQKIIWTMIRMLTKYGVVKSVDKQKQQIYNDMMLKTAKYTEYERGKNLPKAELENHPDLLWEECLDKRDEYEKSAYFTKKNLEHLLFVSFYLLLRPRRAEYRFLKVFETAPTEKQVNLQEDDWIVVHPKGNQAVNMTLNEYKTAKRKQKEFLGQYKKDLPEKLVSLLRQYIKKHERKNGEYLFHDKKGQQLTDKKFSNLVKASCTKVLEMPLTINSFRHLFVSMVVQNYKKFNNNDIKQIALDVGDASIETLLNYRIAEARKEDEGITQIHDRIIEERRKEMERVAQLEDGASGGDVEKFDGDIPYRQKDDDGKSVSVGGGVREIEDMPFF
jgi:hypothetical protein